jgi:predicted small secreted protein
MVRNIVTAAVIGASLALAACNTVRGAAADVNSAANCTEDLIKQGRCR